MATFKGKITAISDIQSGTSKSGNPWRKQNYVLTYDASKPEYPKAIVFSAMNDKIDEYKFALDCEYEVEVDFSAREYNGKYYMDARVWKVTPLSAQPAAAPTQQGWEAAYPPAQPKQRTQPPADANDDIPF